mgnify:CR=1 FL=1
MGVAPPECRGMAQLSGERRTICLAAGSHPSHHTTDPPGGTILDCSKFWL